MAITYIGASRGSYSATTDWGLPTIIPGSIGDYTLLYAYTESGSFNAPPAGWTSVEIRSGGGGRLEIFERVWDVAPDDGGLSAAGNRTGNLVAITWSGVDPTTPRIVSNTKAQTSTTNHTSTAASNTDTDELGVASFHHNHVSAAVVFSPGTNWSTITTVSGGSNNGWCSALFEERTFPTVASQTATATTPTSVTSAIALVILNPAVTGQTYDEVSTSTTPQLVTSTGTVDALVMDEAGGTSVLLAITSATVGELTLNDLDPLASILATSTGTDTATYAPDQQEALLVAFTGGSDTVTLVETSGSVQAIVEALSSVDTQVMAELDLALVWPVLTTGTDTETFAADADNLALLLAVLSGTDTLSSGPQTFDETGGISVLLAISQASETFSIAELAANPELLLVITAADAEFFSTVINELTGEVLALLLSTGTDTATMVELDALALVNAITSAQSSFAMVETSGDTVVLATTDGVAALFISEVGTPQVVLATTTGIDAYSANELTNPSIIYTTSTGIDTQSFAEVDTGLVVILSTTFGIDGGQNDETFGEVLILVVTSGTDSRVLRRLSIYTRSMLVSEQPYSASTLRVESPYTRSTLHTQQPFDQSLLAAG